MSVRLRHGFKAEAERLATEFRSELGLRAGEALDPMKLADLFGLPIISVADLAAFGADPAAIAHFNGGRGTGDLSAFTVFRGSRRLIVVNEAHSTGRRANSLVHEVSHVILEHQPAAAVDLGGNRHWNAEMEEEADWLAGTLLVPRGTALLLARSEETPEAAALRLGVSVQLLKWRLNSSGAAIQAGHENRWRGGARR